MHSRKKRTSLNFTTNARHYAPDYIGHICNIEILCPCDLETAGLIWTINDRKEPGHRRNKGQGLEATLNCAIKNGCRVVSPSNVINRSATVQEREAAKRILKMNSLFSRDKGTQAVQKST